jgi:hypothetical protein
MSICLTGFVLAAVSRLGACAAAAAANSIIVNSSLGLALFIQVSGPYAVDDTDWLGVPFACVEVSTLASQVRCFAMPSKLIKPGSLAIPATTVASSNLVHGCVDRSNVE